MVLLSVGLASMVSAQEGQVKLTVYSDTACANPLDSVEMTPGECDNQDIPKPWASGMYWSIITNYSPSQNTWSFAGYYDEVTDCSGMGDPVDTASGTSGECVAMFAATGTTYYLTVNTSSLHEKYQMLVFGDSSGDCLPPADVTYYFDFDLCNSPPSYVGGASDRWTLSNGTFTNTQYSDTNCTYVQSTFSGDMDWCDSDYIVQATPTYHRNHLNVKPKIILVESEVMSKSQSAAGVLQHELSKTRGHMLKPTTTQNATMYFYGELSSPLCDEYAGSAVYQIGSCVQSPFGDSGSMFITADPANWTTWGATFWSGPGCVQGDMQQMVGSNTVCNVVPGCELCLFSLNVPTIAQCKVQYFYAATPGNCDGPPSEQGTDAFMPNQCLLLPFGEQPGSEQVATRYNVDFTQTPPMMTISYFADVNCNFPLGDPTPAVPVGPCNPQTEEAGSIAMIITCA